MIYQANQKDLNANPTKLISVYEYLTEKSGGENGKEFTAEEYNQTVDEYGEKYRNLAIATRSPKSQKEYEAHKEEWDGVVANFPRKTIASTTDKVVDLAKSFGSGAISAVSDVLNVVPDSVSDNGSKDFLDDTAKNLTNSMTDDSQIIERNNQKLRNQASEKGNIFDVISAGISTLTANNVASGLGSIAPTVGAAFLTGGTSTAAQVASKVVPLALGGAMGVGGLRSNVNQKVYSDAIAAGNTEAEAKRIASVADDYDSIPAYQTAGAAGLGAIGGVFGAEKIANQALLKMGTSNIVKRVAKKGLEEAGEEVLQTGQSSIAANEASIAQGLSDKGLFSGVLIDTVQAGLTGFLTGGAFGVKKGNDIYLGDVQKQLDSQNELDKQTQKEIQSIVKNIGIKQLIDDTSIDEADDTNLKFARELALSIDDANDNRYTKLNDAIDTNDSQKTDDVANTGALEPVTDVNTQSVTEQVTDAINNTETETKQSNNVDINANDAVVTDNVNTAQEETADNTVESNVNDKKALFTDGILDNLDAEINNKLAENYNKNKSYGTVATFNPRETGNKPKTEAINRAITEIKGTGYKINVDTAQIWADEHWNSYVDYLDKTNQKSSANKEKFIKGTVDNILATEWLTSFKQSYTDDKISQKRALQRLDYLNNNEKGWQGLSRQGSGDRQGLTESEYLNKNKKTVDFTKAKSYAESIDALTKAISPAASKTKNQELAIEAGNKQDIALKKLKDFSDTFDLLVLEYGYETAEFILSQIETKIGKNISRLLVIKEIENVINSKYTPFRNIQAPASNTSSDIDATKKRTATADTAEQSTAETKTEQVAEINLTKAQAVEKKEARVLQNRNRSSQTSIAQMQKIAANPDFLRAGISNTMQDGAPIVDAIGDELPVGAIVGEKDVAVDADGKEYSVQYAVVEADNVLTSNQADGKPVDGYAEGKQGMVRAIAGNGRAAGIKQGYLQGNAKQYRETLATKSSKVGINSADFEGMKQPVLIRLMPQSQVTDNIGDVSNVPQTAPLNPTEQAKTDAASLDLDAIEFDENGVTNESVGKWVYSLKGTQSSGLLGDKGEVSKQAISRLSNAIFYKAYGSDELVKLYGESTDPEIVRVINAIGSAAPFMAQLEGTGDYDIRGAVVEAAQIAVNAKRKGEKLGDYLKTVGFTESGEGVAIALFFAENYSSGKSMREGLINLAQTAIDASNLTEQNKTQGGFFEPVIPQTRENIFKGLGNAEQANAITERNEQRAVNLDNSDVKQKTDDTLPKNDTKENESNPVKVISAQERDGLILLDRIKGKYKLLKIELKLDGVTGLPAYSGNKASFITQAGNYIKEMLKDSKHTTIYDPFGGGGGYGLWVAVNATTEVKTVVINEIDTIRSLKTQWILENNGKLAELYKTEKMLKLISILRKVSGTPIGTTLKKGLREISIGSEKHRNYPFWVEARDFLDKNPVTDIEMIALQAIKDRVYNARNPKVTIDSIIRLSIDDAVEYHKNYQKLISRGGKVVFTVGDGTSAENLPENSIVILDPPYVYTEGYNDTGDQTDSVGSPEFFNKTKNTLKNAINKKNFVIYHNSIPALTGVQIGDAYGTKVESSKVKFDGVLNDLDEVYVFERAKNGLDDFFGVKNERFNESYGSNWNGNARDFFDRGRVANDGVARRGMVGEPTTEVLREAGATETITQQPKAVADNKTALGEQFILDIKARADLNFEKFKGSNLISDAGRFKRAIDKLKVSVSDIKASQFDDDFKKAQEIKDELYSYLRLKSKEFDAIEKKQDLTLTQQTADEARQAILDKEAEDKERSKADARIEAKRKAEQKAKEVKQAGANAADNFTLGGSAEDELSGQNDIFKSLSTNNNKTSTVANLRSAIEEVYGNVGDTDKKLKKVFLHETFSDLPVELQKRLNNDSNNVVRGVETQKIIDSANYVLRRKDGVLLRLPIDFVLDNQESDFKVERGRNEIGNRIDYARNFLKSAPKDLEASVIYLKNSGENKGKISFEDGRHRLIAAKELGATHAYFELSETKEQLDSLKRLALEFENKNNDASIQNSVKPFYGIEKAVTPLGNTKTVTVGGKEYSVFNSDGKPIHPTIEGVRNFVRWFGDSLVTDNGKTMANGGKPMVVYHGTNADFDVFDKNKIGSESDFGYFGRGFYFSIDSNDKNYGENRKPVYLNIKNYKENNTVFETKEKSQEFTDKAKKNNFDGIAKPKYYDGDYFNEWFIAFSSNQIKSATGNNGDFDIDNNSILKSKNESTAQAFYDPASGGIHLIADRINQGEEQAVFLHEIMHKQELNLLSKENLNLLYNAVQDWKTKLADTIERQVYEDANRRATNSENYNGEFLNYAIEETAKRGIKPDITAPKGSIANWFAQVFDAFNRALNKLLTGARVKNKNIDFTVQDLMSMAYGAAGLEYKAGDTDVQLNYNDDGQHLAPNGKVSKLTEQQAKTVRTEAFKNWFGDWENDPENASKVVDKNGEPMVVYHGTDKQFNEFNDKFMGRNATSYGKGFYFTPRLSFAKTYNSSNQIPAFLNIKSFFDLNKNTIKKDYLNKIINELPMIDYGKNYDNLNNEDLKDNFINMLLKKENDIDVFDTLLDAIQEKTYNYLKKKNEKTLLKDRDKLANLFKKVNGYDGSKTNDNEIIVAFSSNQIKLADGTNTTFDDNNDIRFSKKDDLIKKGVNALNLGNVNKPSDERPSFEATERIAKSGTVQQKVSSIKEIKDKTVTALTDSTRPHDVWATDNLTDDEALPLIRAKNLAAGREAAFNKEVLIEFGDAISRATKAIVNNSKLKNKPITFEAALRLGGEYMSAVYAPIANQNLLKKDKELLKDAEVKQKDNLQQLLSIEKDIEEVQSLLSGGNRTLKQVDYIAMLQRKQVRLVNLIDSNTLEPNEKLEAELFQLEEDIKDARKEFSSTTNTSKNRSLLVSLEREFKKVSKKETEFNRLVNTLTKNFNDRKKAIENDQVIDPTKQDLETPLAGGLNNASAKHLMGIIEKTIPKRLLENLANEVYKMNEWKLQKDIEIGKVTQEVADKFDKSGKYVPLTGDPSLDDSGGKSFESTKPNVSKDYKLQGRKTSLAIDGISASFEQIQKTAKYHAWNDYKDALHSTYENRLNNYINNGKTKSEAEDAVFNDIGISRNSNEQFASYDGITYRKNGEFYSYDLGNIGAIEALRSTNVEDIPSAIRYIAQGTRVMSKLVTQLMFGFAPTNSIRDVWEKSENIRARKYKNVDMNKVASDMLKISLAQAKSIHKDISTVVSKGTWLSGKFKIDPKNENQKLLMQFANDGGLSTFGDFISTDGVDLSKKLAGMNTKLSKTMDAIAVWNDSFEIVSSLSAYKALLKNGVPSKDAAELALELMNFRKGGTRVKPIKAVYMFAQPIATGGHQLVKTLSTPVGQKRFLAYMLGGMALYALLRSGEDDEETGLNKMDETSNFQTERNIVIPIGNGNTVNIPIGFGLPMLAWGYAVNLDKMLLGRQTAAETVAELAKIHVKTFAPVAPSETSISAQPTVWFAQTITPTLFKPVINVALDRTFAGAPLTSARFEKPDNANALEGKASTADFYKDIAKQMANFGFDVYPEQVKEVLKGYGVGLFSEILKATVDNPAKESNGIKTANFMFDRIIKKQDNKELVNKTYYRIREQLNDVGVKNSLNLELNNYENRKFKLLTDTKEKEASFRGKKSAITKAFNKNNNQLLFDNSVKELEKEIYSFRKGLILRNSTIEALN